jgi:hypothetical protein
MSGAIVERAAARRRRIWPLAARDGMVGNGNDK